MFRTSVELMEYLPSQFGRGTVLGQHGLPGHELFTDEALAALLDRIPRNRLYAFSMGTDPERPEENHMALHDGVSGAELLRAVRNGRLWLNATRINQADERYSQLIGDLYRGLVTQVPGFAPERNQGTLLISSPRAQVYYHADGPASVLWHVRGRKRVWVYPALDPRFVTRELLEDVIAGARHEYLPYRPTYDSSARVFDLQPGQWISWPQNSPHRIENLDSLNVSLSTEHFTKDTRRRCQVYVANRFFRTKLDIRKLSGHEHGPAAVSKIMVQRIARAIGLDALPVKEHIPSLRVAPDAPNGVVPLEQGS